MGFPGIGGALRSTESPCLVRGQYAFRDGTAKNVSLGAYLAYGYFVVERVSDRRHSTELMARVSFLF